MLEEVDRDKHNKRVWKCECKCGGYRVRKGWTMDEIINGKV